MSAEQLFRILLVLAIVSWLVGLTLAEFARLHALGMVLVLAGIAAAGGAGSLYVIVQAREKQAQQK